MSAVIYISRLNNPIFNVVNQRNFCFSICQKKKLRVTNIVIENEDGYSEFNRLMDNLKNYDYFVMISLSCLGDGYVEINRNLTYLLENIKVISLFDPIDGENFENEAVQKFIINSSIAYAVHQNEMYEELLQNVEIN